MDVSLLIDLVLFGALLLAIVCCGLLAIPRVDDEGFAHPSPLHDDDPYTY